MDEVINNGELTVSLVTYVGLAGLAALAIQGIKKFWKGIKGKEGWFALGIPLVVGCAVKALGSGFSDASWMAHIVALLGAGVGSGLLHDKIGGPLQSILGMVGKLTKKKEKVD